MPGGVNLKKNQERAVFTSKSRKRARGGARAFFESQFLMKRQHKKTTAGLKKAQITLRQKLLPFRTPLGDRNTNPTSKGTPLTPLKRRSTSRTPWALWWTQQLRIHFPRTPSRLADFWRKPRSRGNWFAAWVRLVGRHRPPPGLF